MKGIVFVEFLELVENKFGLDMIDDIIDEADLESGGAYTSVGTYSHKELLELVGLLSDKSGISIEDLVKVFGEYLLERFTKNYPAFFQEVDSCFEFLDTIENKVHVEVKKLYPEAELPTFTSNIVNKNNMELVYKSKRPFSALAYGLIKGSASYFKENITIDMKDLSDKDNTQVIFNLKKI